jgi:hypothetical protein
MKKPTMDRRMLARVVIGGGMFLVLISLFADPLGLGRLLPSAGGTRWESSSGLWLAGV